ncbi:MAG: hypothetical protein NTW87_25215, partial [Planctomycetota bacterium]|nr:hypothetical protein [Planctomycetota bacterium]
MTREMIVLLLAFASCIAWTGESEPPTTPCDLTVYDRDRTLVQEKRRFDVTEGASRIVLPEVPPAAEAASIRFKWPAQAGIEVLEQNLEYDLVNPNALLLKYLGKEVELHMRDGTKNSGQLLYFDESVFIVRSPQSKTVDLVDRFENVRQVRFLELPENLSLRPSLVCQVNSKRAGPSECDMSYVTHQFDWRADYIAVLDAKDQELELSSWVSLNNKSGTTYNAGRVRVATDEHHYDLPRPTVVRHNQLKQVRLFPTVSGIKGEKRLIVGNDYLGCSGRPLPVRICV